jgi:hypothetical protein
VNDGSQLYLVNSTVHHNTGTEDGSGIMNFSGGSTVLDSSTVSANQQSGIYNQGGRLEVHASTVTDNGFGIVNETADPALLLQAIVAGNQADHDLLGPFRSGTYNLVGNGEGSSGLTDGGLAHDQVGTTASPIDPMLRSPVENWAR